MIVSSWKWWQKENDAWIDLYNKMNLFSNGGQPVKGVVININIYDAINCFLFPIYPDVDKGRK